MLVKKEKDIKREPNMALIKGVKVGKDEKQLLEVDKEYTVSIWSARDLVKAKRAVIVEEYYKG